MVISLGKKREEMGNSFHFIAILLAMKSVERARGAPTELFSWWFTKINYCIQLRSCKLLANSREQRWLLSRSFAADGKGARWNKVVTSCGPNTYSNLSIIVIKNWGSNSKNPLLRSLKLCHSNFFFSSEWTLSFVIDEFPYELTDDYVMLIWPHHISYIDRSIMMIKKKQLPTHSLCRVHFCSIAIDYAIINFLSLYHKFTALRATSFLLVCCVDSRLKSMLCVRDRSDSVLR